MKKTFFILVLMTIVCNTPTNISAQSMQGWINLGTIINQEIIQNNTSSKTSFNPDIELGIRFPGESIIGGSISANFRFMNIEKIEWPKKSSTKFLYDFYAGPSLYIPFYESSSVSGFMLNPSLGISFSAPWFHESIIWNSLSAKINADIIFSGFSIGVTYRPLKQRVEGDGFNSSSAYLQYNEFTLRPAFEIRLGYVGQIW